MLRYSRAIPELEIATFIFKYLFYSTRVIFDLFNIKQEKRDDERGVEKIICCRSESTSSDEKAICFAAALLLPIIRDINYSLASSHTKTHWLGIDAI